MSRIKVQRSLSGLYWCVTLDGDATKPLYQSERKYQATKVAAKLQSNAKY